jgi:hypothetical protein
VDGGFVYWNAVPFVQLYPTSSGTGQQFTWTGKTLKNEMVAGGGSSGANGPYMADNGDGTVTENATGDAWTIRSSGNGYTVLNNRTGRYLSIVSNALGCRLRRPCGQSQHQPCHPNCDLFLPGKRDNTDNMPAGTVVTGTSTTSNTDLFAMSGMNIVTAWAFTSTDDGFHSTVITASQSSQSFSLGVSV